ncbi:PREDICTED: piriformospora indica-insensitive protein 2-like isoform X2 [Tarenaya hassleriana]|uniref:piriformospora indica-insensitive protein 2-like isoform X2 n=1 Tax=Tarenaya hassleriana TaxID=28532 RepID=UPI00053C97F8|nr:PREDICTED: piriformospora indica-insensitive protein 2-like isoform X2 [Tarenaya hassleriana]
MFCWRTLHSFLFLCLVLHCTGEFALDDSDEAPMAKTEREALYSAIQGFVGDSSWNGSDLYPDPCGWTPIQGVSCDVFDGLWHLKSLTFFNCFTSPIKITGEDWLSFESSLESLEFRSNPGLVGELPETIGNLKKLQSLVVLGNGFRGKLQSSICNLTRLKRLVLAGNSFTGTIPDCFHGQKELLILDLSRNYFSGPLPSFGELGSLLKLDLSNNLLEGKLPKEIGFLKNLTLLDLRNNKFSGGLSRSVEKMQSLTELVLAKNPIGGDLMGIKWAKMDNLVILDISNMGLKGEIPTALTNLKRLRFLGLNDNNLTGNVPSKLETLPCLGALYINGNNLTGKLEFSRMFYEKMGRRFGASRNPNLCYPLEIMSASQQHVPVGVKPCTGTMTRPEGNLVIQQDSRNLIWNQRFSSKAVFLHVIDGFMWVWLLMVISIIVL